MAWRLALVVLLAGCHGCQYGGELTGEYRCDDGICPAGLSCVAGRCIEGGGMPDAAAADAVELLDAAPPGDAGPAWPCNTVRLYADDLDDQSIDSETPYAEGTATTIWVGGRL